MRPALLERRWVSLALLGLAEVLALSLWFSATAVVPDITREFGLQRGTASLFSSAVALGFVVGTLISASLGLADRLEPRTFFSVSALLGGAANILILFVEPAGWAPVGLRFVTGMAIAGIYPVGMKIASTWARGDMGLLIGLLVGALTLGSALPHLVNVLGGLDWRTTIRATSLLALVAAGLIRLVRLGPMHTRAARFHWRQATEAFTRPALRLANLGYLGHMWELYAMWAWVGVFLTVNDALRLAGGTAGLLTFLVIAVGAAGCLFGGLFADRRGRTTLTMLAMGLSGTMAILAAVFAAGPVWLLVGIALVWGFFVVADSAQFSASVIELSPPGLRGTMLTVQTSAGFLLTLISIHIVPLIAAEWGWPWALAILAPGPFLGVLAMGRLRARPEAAKLAGGRR